MSENLVQKISSFAMALVLAASTSAATEQWSNLTRDREIDLALSAAPEHLRQDAAVYVLGDQGYEKVRDSQNGFACLIQRISTFRAPVCYDAEGVRTTLQADLRRGELQAQGVSDKEISETLDAEYKSGKLKAPSRPGVAYMLSPDFVRLDPETGEASSVFPPHVMFYAPYMTNEDIGALPEHTNSYTTPWVLTPGQPTSYIIVVPPEHLPEDG